jgi:hypothetical protein
MPPLVGNAVLSQPQCGTSLSNGGVKQGTRPAFLLVFCHDSQRFRGVDGAGHGLTSSVVFSCFAPEIVPGFTHCNSLPYIWSMWRDIYGQRVCARKIQRSWDWVLVYHFCGEGELS